jgi:hypothetical protein
MPKHIPVVDDGHRIGGVVVSYYGRIRKHYVIDAWTGDLWNSEGELRLEHASRDGPCNQQIGFKLTLELARLFVMNPEVIACSCKKEKRY